ncbi:MAG: sensor histidine kinase [Opitutaceae bacterium]
MRLKSIPGGSGIFYSGPFGIRHAAGEMQAGHVSDVNLTHLIALSVHLASRRAALLEAWHAAAGKDPVQTTISFLTRTEFNDHIPQLLDAFQRKLCARPGGSQAATADQDKSAQDVKHGLQRWQQGYQLSELMHEWGHLHLCVFEEIEAFASAHPEMSRVTLTVAHRELMSLINEGINKSAGQYSQLQRAEAAGHVQDLQRTLAQVNELERQRAALIRQAVHDLRGNVQSVSSAAEVLRTSGIAEEERVEFASLVQQGIEAVGTMVAELMELARLEAGLEQRELASFDVANLLEELCVTTRPVADARKLFLKTAGPATLMVEGDAVKVRRLVQNLLFNALKYTEQGGVTVSWAEEKDRWWVIVKDTGPGLLDGPGAPIAARLTEATDSARDAAEQAARQTGEKPTVLPAPVGGPVRATRQHQRTGEGIGLSIVKRLSELLDASIELASSAATGTTFRVVFPRSYQAPPKS